MSTKACNQPDGSPCSTEACKIIPAQLLPENVASQCPALEPISPNGKIMFKFTLYSPSRISQWMERKAEVERMLSAAAAKKEFAVSEAELMAGEEKAMLLAEQAQKSTPPKVDK